MTRTEYDSIFVVMDHFTKETEFILYVEASLADELAYVFLRHIVSRHRLLESIISDRGMIFVSKF